MNYVIDPRIIYRWAGTIRGASSRKAVHRSMVSGHGARHRRLQDQAERHPGAVQGGHQTDVRFLSARRQRPV